MGKMTTTGNCGLCARELPKASMTNHLKSCAARAPGTEARLHLVVEGRYAPMFWLHLEVKPTAKLADLDVFLRRHWLECCGHLSSFQIGRTRYESHPDGYDNGAKTMRCALENVLRVGDSFEYEYDFGSTTDLKLKVVGERRTARTKEAVRIVAENRLPPFKCLDCNAAATTICTECSWSDGGWLCAKCAKKHECGGEMLLPVVNSPRVGTCAYGAAW